MSRIKIGDLFELQTPVGKAFLHYICKDDIHGHLIRVLRDLLTQPPESLKALVEAEERFMIYFPLSAAHHRGIVKKVGNFPAIGFEKPKYMRSVFNVQGEHRGWHIVNTENLQRILVKTLSAEQKKLSPWGIWNDTLLVEKLTSGWKLEDWS